MAKKTKITLERIEKEMRYMDPKLSETDPTFEAGVILMASWVVGPNIKRISDFTLYTREVVAEYSKNFREGGLWRGGKILHSEPYDGVQFWLDVSVGLGHVRIEREGT